MNADEQNIVRSETVLDDDHDRALRPRTLADFQGQEQIRNNLSVFIRAARERNESLDHLFLIGPPGLGKTTLAQITANELGVDFKVTSAPALDKPKDLAGILTSVTERTVFFIDEIHRLKPAIEEMLYIAMEDYELDWIIGQGPSARTVRIPIPPFTLIGATTRAGMVSSPLISRFGIVQRFTFYSDAELTAIIRRSALILGVTIQNDAALDLAHCSRGTPRVANRLLRRMRDYAQVLGDGLITRKVVAKSTASASNSTTGRYSPPSSIIMQAARSAPKPSPSPSAKPLIRSRTTTSPTSSRQASCNAPPGGAW